MQDLNAMTEDQLVAAAVMDDMGNPDYAGAMKLLEEKYPHRVAKESGLMHHITRGNVKE